MLWRLPLLPAQPTSAAQLRLDLSWVVAACSWLIKPLRLLPWEISLWNGCIMLSTEPRSSCAVAALPFFPGLSLSPSYSTYRTDFGSTCKFAVFQYLLFYPPISHINIELSGMEILWTQQFNHSFVSAIVLMHNWSWYIILGFPQNSFTPTLSFLLLISSSPTTLPFISSRCCRS